MPCWLHPARALVSGGDESWRVAAAGLGRVQSIRKGACARDRFWSAHGPAVVAVSRRGTILPFSYLVFGYLAADLQANGYEAMSTAETLLDEDAEEVTEAPINSLAARVKDRPAVPAAADLVLPSSSLPLPAAARSQGPRLVEPEQATGAIPRPLERDGGPPAAEGRTYATTSQQSSEKAPRPGSSQA